MVGDAHQTIYSFAGASPEPLLTFRRRFPRAHVVRLVRDYRSTPQVVALANAVIAKAAAVGPWADLSLTLTGQRAGRPRPGLPPSTTTSRPRPPRWPPAAGSSCVRAPPPRRSPSCSGSTPRARCTRRRSPTPACPTCSSGGARFFDRPEVREALLLLRGAARAVADDDAAEGGLLAAVREVLAAASAFDPAAPPAGAGAVRDRWESLNALLRARRGAGRRPRRGPTSPRSCASWRSGPRPSTPRPWRG